VKPGDTLVRSKPFVYAIQPQFKNKVCEYCLTFHDTWKAIEMCSRCEAVGYCSEQCRLQHLPQHRVECELCVLRGKRIWPHRAWFVARAVLKVEADGSLEKEPINQKRSRCFNDLMDHYEDITGDLDLGDCWYTEVSNLLGSLMPEKEEYLRIYGRLAVNSFALRVDANGEEENVGTALYRAASIFDHSCAPNATTVFNPGGVLEMKAMTASPALDLSNYYISYLDESDPRRFRLAKLSRTWYFTCGCSKCANTTSETEKHAALCQESRCDGCVHVDVDSWTWEPCSKCCLPLDLSGREKYCDVYQIVRSVIDENGGECNFTDVAEFLVRQMEKVFHPSDLEMMQACMSAAQGHYAAKSWQKCLFYQSKAIIGIRKNYGYYSGYVGVGLQRLAESYYHTEDFTNAVKTIQECHEIMKHVPGEYSYYFQTYFLPIYEKITKTKIK